MNLNNIDDIFKEGLAEYSEQPSKSLWNRISGKLLKYELFRLNFINVPKLWVGAAAAGVVAISLLVFNPFVSNPEETSANLLEQQDEGFIEKNQPNQSIFIPEELKEQSTHAELSTSSLSETGEIAIAPEQDESVVVQSFSANNTNLKDAQTREEADIKKNSVTKLPVDKQTQQNEGTILADELQINDAPEIQDQKIKEPISIYEDSELAADKEINNKTIVATGITTAAITANDPKTGKNTNQVNKSGSGNQGSNVLPVESSDDVKITELEKRNTALFAEGLIQEDAEIKPMDQPGTSLNSLDLNNQETGKIQKMHSKSYAMVQFFKGKYKPPKRKFNENTASFYKFNKPYYTLAAYFSPEFTDYARMASSSWERSYIGGLSLTYNNERFIFEGGLEYSYTNDLGDYMVDMETYDSIGYYNEVGSFIPDPDNPGEVIFETNTVMVYDSVQHNLHEQTQNQYSYLQLPLLIGYQAVERGLFSAYIKAGPSFSFLLNKQEQNPDFNNPDATVNQIENYTPVRQNTSIQVLVSVRFKFQLNENMGIMAEPTYRYYVKSVYENTDNTLKNPYGIGVRFGLYYDL